MEPSLVETKLRKLQDRIEGRFGDSAWLFEKIGKVRGYQGTGFCMKYGKKIMFVAERPSKGGLEKRARAKRAIEVLRKDSPLRMFYRALERFNLENAHITDFIKTKAKAGEWSYDDLKENLEIFEEEFTIVNPDVVIAVGKRGYDWLCLYLLTKKADLKPDQLMHYSQRKPIERYEHKFIENLKEIVGKIS